MVEGFMAGAALGAVLTAVGISIYTDWSRPVFWTMGALRVVQCAAILGAVGALIGAAA